MASILEIRPPALADIIDALESSPLVSYVVDGDLLLAYRNLAWDKFAAENGAPELVGEGALGADLPQAIGDSLRPFYLQAFQDVARTRTAWDCLYECSSPTVFRKFRMRIQPLRPPGWALVTSARVIERPHAAPVLYGLEAYLNSAGQITMCSHCRCCRKTDHPEQWDFVPAHLDRNLENISHGLCPVCLDYFYPKP